MIRVAHVLYSYLPVTQNWIYTQLRANRRCDHRVLSLTEENVSQFPWEHRSCAFPPGRMFSAFRLLLARYRIIQPAGFFRSTLQAVRPDVVHGHFSTESWRVFNAVRAAGLPLVTTFYGLDVDKLSRRRAWKPRYRALFAYGSRFIVEGPFMADRLCAIGCPREKISVVPLGVDLQRYPVAAGSRTGSDDATRVLFVGLDREKKGPIDAVTIFSTAAAKMPGLELHIAGNGRYRTEVEQALDSAGLRSRAVFHGYVSYDKYRAILADCDVVLVPSRHAADGDSEGGAPVVCIEAQASGKPVVGSRHCDIPFVVRHGESGLLSDERDTGSMARDLMRLATDAALRQRMGACGRLHVQQQHDSIVLAESMAGLYQELVQKGRLHG
jgi:colanic acid/amylovoran biosynthesis glycosyltransferase